MINVSYKIKSERIKKKMTQEKLAEKILVSRQTISNWENGRAFPNYENLVLLSKIFNIPVDHFYIDNLENQTVLYPRFRSQDQEKKGLWNIALLILLIISVLIPYSAPISLCVLFIWKEKLTPRLFKRALIFIVFFVMVEIIVAIYVLSHMIN